MVGTFGSVVSGCSPTGTTATCVPRNPLVLGKQGRLVTPLCRPSGLCCSCSAVPLKCCSSWKREETEGAWLWAHKTSFMKSSGQAEGFAAPCSEAAVSLTPHLHESLFPQIRTHAFAQLSPPQSPRVSGTRLLSVGC